MLKNLESKANGEALKKLHKYLHCLPKEIIAIVTTQQYLKYHQKNDCIYLWIIQMPMLFLVIRYLFCQMLISMILAYQNLAFICRGCVWQLVDWKPDIVIVIRLSIIIFHGRMLTKSNVIRLPRRRKAFQTHGNSIQIAHQLIYMTR